MAAASSPAVPHSKRRDEELVVWLTVGDIDWIHSIMESYADTLIGYHPASNLGSPEEQKVKDELAELYDKLDKAQARHLETVPPAAAPKAARKKREPP